MSTDVFDSYGNLKKILRSCKDNGGEDPRGSGRRGDSKSVDIANWSKLDHSHLRLFELCYLRFRCRRSGGCSRYNHNLTELVVD